MNFFCALVFSFVLAGFAGCQEKTTGEDSPFSLKTSTLKIAGHTITVEIADDPQTMATGLMFRKTMPQDHGMIFVFPTERQASFWMHNTDLPLDIAYLDRTGKLLEVHAAQPHDDSPIPSATANIAYALEMNQGWFQKKGVPLGTKIENLPAFPPRN